MPLKDIENLRVRIARGFANELLKVRTNVLPFNGNNEACDRLVGKLGDKLLADLVNATLRHLGHEPESFVRNPRGVAGRAAKRLVGA